MSRPERPPGRAARVGDLAVRVGGGLVCLAGGLLVGSLALLWVSWRVEIWSGPVRVPFAVVVAVAGMSVLLWYAPQATGTRWGVLLPGAGWFVIVVVATGTTAAGDRLLPADDWVAGLTLFGGTIAVVIGSALALTSRP